MRAIIACWSLQSGGLRLDTNRLDTSHSQRLNSGKHLGTGRCGWWCPIEPCPNGTLLLQLLHWQPGM